MEAGRWTASRPPWFYLLTVTLICRYAMRRPALQQEQRALAGESSSSGVLNPNVPLVDDLRKNASTLGTGKVFSNSIDDGERGSVAANVTALGPICL